MTLTTAEVEEAQKRVGKDYEGRPLKGAAMAKAKGGKVKAEPG